MILKPGIDRVLSIVYSDSIVYSGIVCVLLSPNGSSFSSGNLAGGDVGSREVLGSRVAVASVADSSGGGLIGG